MEHYSSAFLVLYLGKLPAYFDFWAKSCEPNHRHFKWFVYNDRVEEKTQINKAVTLVPYDFDTLRSDLKDCLDIQIPAGNTRIVCDCRLVLYPLRKEEEGLDQFDFIGYSDIDVIYGKISQFLPENALEYSVISAENNRPCGPFTLLNRKYLSRICRDHAIKKRLELDHGDNLYESEPFRESNTRFQPMSGNQAKDEIANKIEFEHLDESRVLLEISGKYAPVFCEADPLQPTSKKWFNHRKAVGFYEKGKLIVRDNFGHRSEGAVFHFSRFKNRERFKIDPNVLQTDNWGIYKYGIIEIKSVFTKLKIMLSLLY